MKYKFEDGFYWGSAVSALQTEGTHKGDAEDMDDKGYIHDDVRIEFVKSHLRWI